MAEAESLCDKVAILINGRFVCLDTLQQLKNKFGSGVRISVKLKREEDLQDIDELV
jgi:ATP-binding cassette subfamily A (ABC1) protein 3